GNNPRERRSRDARSGCPGSSSPPSVPSPCTRPRRRPRRDARASRGLRSTHRSFGDGTSGRSRSPAAPGCQSEEPAREDARRSLVVHCAPPTRRGLAMRMRTLPFLLGALLFACTSESKAPAPTPAQPSAAKAAPTPTPTNAAGQIEIVANEKGFSPSKIWVEAGKPVKLLFTRT